MRASMRKWSFYHSVMGSTPILATKLFAPARRQQLVERPRVVERLGFSIDASHRLTLVSAPAGFGKTTLLSEWLTDLDQQQSHMRLGWLSLDDGDNDSARFMAHLVAALTAPDSMSTRQSSSRSPPPRRPRL